MILPVAAALLQAKAPLSITLRVPPAYNPTKPVVVVFRNGTSQPIAVASHPSYLSLRLIDSDGQALSSASYLSRIEIAGLTWNQMHVIPAHGTAILNARLWPLDKDPAPGRYTLSAAYWFRPASLPFGKRPKNLKGVSIPAVDLAAAPVRVDLD